MASAKPKDCSVLVADLMGFGRLARETDPALLLALLNKLFAVVVPPVERLGGVVSGFAGDSFLAHFGAAKRLPDHARRAVAAAIQVQRAAALFRAKAGKALHLAVCVNTGPVAFGKLGAGRAARPTVIGGAVNIASMLTGLRQPDRVLIGSATAAVVQRDFELRPQSPLTHPSLTVEVFEVAGEAAKRKR